MSNSSTALVFGAAVWPGARPSPTLLRRTKHAVALYHSGQVGQIVVSGGLGQHPPSEAVVMREICLDAGIDGAKIILEEKAVNTLQNIRFSLDRAPSADLTLVTDCYHAPRVWLTARALGVRANVSCPAMTGTKRIRVIKSWLREGIALPFYVLKLTALRLSGRL